MPSMSCMDAFIFSELATELNIKSAIVTGTFQKATGMALNREVATGSEISVQHGGLALRLELFHPHCTR